MSSDFYTSSILPHAGIIIKICRAYTDSQEDFEDYYQEVCLQIWRSKDSFKEQSEWSTWIYRLTLNVCLTLVKKTRKIKEHITLEHQPVDMTEELASGFSDESLAQLYAAMRQLSEIDRAVILLYLEEKSYQEISVIIGTNANNVGVRIKRIKERLKKILDGKLN